MKERLFYIKSSANLQENRELWKLKVHDNRK